jgi:hypothetical protein
MPAAARPAQEHLDTCQSMQAAYCVGSTSIPSLDVKTHLVAQLVGLQVGHLLQQGTLLRQRRQACNHVVEALHMMHCSMQVEGCSNNLPSCAGGSKKTAELSLYMTANHHACAPPGHRTSGWVPPAPRCRALQLQHLVRSPCGPTQCWSSRSAASCTRTQIAVLVSHKR